MKLDPTAPFARVDSSALVEASAHLPRLEASTDEDRARSIALRLALWFAGLPGGRRPEPEAVDALVGRADAELLCWICGRAALACAIGFDRDGVEAWLGPHRRAAPEGSPRLAVTRAWAAVMAGGEEDLETSLSQASVDARSRGDAAAVVECNVLRALNALCRDEPEEATRAARLASRMARTESLSQSEFLAHLVLARVRRAGGAAHLALHILEALRGAASAPWQSWIALEATLAGRIDASRGSGGASAADHLLAVRDALRAGDRARFEQGASGLLAATASFRLLHAELSELLAGLDVQRAPASEAMRGWAEGARSLVPAGLHAFGVDEAGHLAYVVRDGTPEGAEPKPGRRVLGVGATLALGRDPGRADGQPRKRTEAGLASLALSAEERVDEGAFFHRIYGFEYEHALHHTVLDALVHRMRQALGESGSIARRGGSLRLVPHATIAVVDPRCAVPLDDRVLRALAIAGQLGAREAAAQLDVPLRTVQRSLSELSDAGMCLKVREGRRVAYRVEDTTFSEPTRSGVLLPSSLRSSG